MISCFSGTGNSRYIADKIADALDDEVISVNDRLKAADYGKIETEKPLVFVSPTYAWRMPRVMREWIEKTDFPKGAKAWFVMTCGSEIGNAAKYNRELADEKGFIYMGTHGIRMPENYTAMFPVPGAEKIKKIISAADGEISKTVPALKAGKPFVTPRHNLYDKAMSGIVNPAFYSMCVKADPFRVLDSCIGCGKCEQLCPLNNIKLVSGKPSWGESCTHCMACINYCPAEAIEYGRKSVGKARYHL